MDFKDLSDEQKAKAKACETPEDILALAKEEGVELTDEELAKVSGGANDWTHGQMDTCVKCGSHNLEKTRIGNFICLDCGYEMVTL